MTAQTQTTPQPEAQTIIRVQKNEIDRLNDNRIYLLATVEEIREEAMTEIERLNGVISKMRSLVPDDDQDQVEEILAPAAE